MRGFLFGVVMGAFATVWGLGALPAPVESFLNGQVIKLGEMAGIDLGGMIGGREDASDDEEAPGAVPLESSGNDGGSEAEEADAVVYSDEGDALRRGGVFDGSRLSEVYTCPGMSITARPAEDASGKLTNFSSLIDVNGVFLSRAPVSHGCFSSGYGERNGKLHRGVDYHSEAASNVHAAADGIVVEAIYRDDYGNMAVVDHGNGVYTRYAHLKSFASGIEEGATVTSQTVLGPMGQSAGYRVVVHLHYEILLGDYNTAAKSFGLTATDPMK